MLSGLVVSITVCSTLIRCEYKKCKKYRFFSVLNLDNDRSFENNQGDFTQKPMSEVCKCMRYVKHVNVYFTNQNTMQRVGMNGIEF